MLYRNNNNIRKSSFYNSISQNINNNIINDNCIFWTIVNSIMFIFVLYYCVLALVAIASSEINNKIECNNALLFIFVCMTIFVSIGLVVSHISYRIKKTDTRLAICMWFVMSILGLYCLILMEMSDKCSLENVINKNISDLYLISWIWINIVSFCILFTFLFITYIVISYHNDNSRYNKNFIQEYDESHEL